VIKHFSSGSFDGARRWVAIKLLERDPYDVRKRIDRPDLDIEIDKAQTRLTALLGDPPDILIATALRIHSGACQETVRYTVESRHTMSDQIDQVLTIRFSAFRFFWP
jgi:ferrous iron transport protein B